MNRHPLGWQPHLSGPAMHDNALYFILLIFPLSFFLCLVGATEASDLYSLLPRYAESSQLGRPLIPDRTMDPGLMPKLNHSLHTEQ